jgi:succinate dehydrogenase/fumarate reductase flavoprotein subunit
MQHADSEVDIVVVGSGGAGLTAALAAAVAGGDVLVTEAAQLFGGTTAVSGGQVWVPNNHRMAEVGIGDSADDARTYCLGAVAGRDIELIDAFLDAAPVMARFVETHTPIRFTPMHFPDSYAERPGGKVAGRNLEVAPLPPGEFSPWEQWLWTPPYPPVLTNDEVSQFQLISGGAFPMELVQQRMAAGEVALGVGLVVGLLRGCQAAGVRLERRRRVRRLLRDESGAVVGVQTDCGDMPLHINARRGVVLATGGFEHDQAIATSLLPWPQPLAGSPPVGRGDGLRLATEAGAALGYLSESWAWPMLAGGDDTWGDPERTARPSLVIAERALPHVIWVNPSGRRFVNEASHNCALAFSEIDPATQRPRNVPAWAIGDAQYRRRYAAAGVMPGQQPPDWLPEADTLADLAQAIDVDADALEATVARFNRFAEAGRDEDFSRGAAPYDQALGDREADHPNLGTIEAPPFFAVRIHPGVVGTKGGPRTDGNARVIGWDGAPVPGLYAAGNASAAVIGPGTISAGLTLGLALTWGWLAGTTAAS